MTKIAIMTNPTMETLVLTASLPFDWPARPDDPADGEPPVDEPVELAAPLDDR